MTPKEFWNSTLSEFFAYQKAYINRVHNQAHIIGAYINVAFQTCLYNSFGRKKKNEKVLEYPKEQVFNPFIVQKQTEKTFIETITSTENNNKTFHLKRMLKEMRGGK